MPIAAVIMVLLRYAYERYTQSEMYQETEAESLIVGVDDADNPSREDVVIIVASAPAADTDSSVRP